MARTALFAGVGGLLLGLGLAAAWPLSARPAAPKAEEPPARSWDANLFMQVSAEYRACCMQAYNWAEIRLKQKLAQPRKGDRAPAVVLDLDETVFDNSPYQSLLLRQGFAFDLGLFQEWEQRGAEQLLLVPGAKEFLLEAQRLGVTPIYISNRTAGYAPQAKAALVRFGLPIQKDTHLKFATNETGSDKTSRRKEATDECDVLLYLGDNLRDFDERFKSVATPTKSDQELAAAGQGRKEQVDQTKAQWGDDWIIIPNPAYGEWTKTLGLGQRDLDRLVPSAKLK